MTCNGECTNCSGWASCNHYKNEDKIKENKDEEYVFKATSKQAEDFIKSLAGTDRKLSKLLYMKLSPGEKIKYKMLLTKSHKKYLASKNEIETSTAIDGGPIIKDKK